MNNPIDNIIHPQQPIDSQSNAHELKSRLEWGEPAFTILDVSDRMVYNDGHIMGAMSMSKDRVVEIAKNTIAPSRDIYIYGETDEETSLVAKQLRSVGFEHISELKGGLPAWKAIGGPTEGIIESRTPAGADDYNVVSRLQNHAETQKKDV